MDHLKAIGLLFVLYLFLAPIGESFGAKVAIIQYEIKDPDGVGRDANALERYIRQAAANGAQLIVAPETCFYRYEPWEQNGVTMLDLANHYNELKNKFSGLAKELQVSLVIGLREPSDDMEKPVYNTALFFGPDGSVLGKQHKIMPSNSEKEWTKAGTSHNVFETPIGRIGMLICKSAKTHWWNKYKSEDNLDLFVLIAGDNNATSFDKFSTICNKANCYGILANQITGPDGEGRKGNSAWGYPNGNVTFLGGDEQIFYTELPIPIKNEFKPQHGQVMVDPDNPMCMVYNRDSNNDGQLDPFFMCGPGDPESFLYRGKRNTDGTRDGDQLQLIEKLRENGGNCIYLMAIRTHGGDAWKDVESDPKTYPDDKHNPWVLQNSAYGLNPDILDQWEIWFSEMDKSGITIYFFIYDDAINVGEQLGWPLDDSGNLHPGERQFIEDLVNKFEHHKNLIWCVMEEGQEIGKDWQQHVSKIAEAIREADDYDHIIASHQLPGGDFYHAEDPNIDQFAIQSAIWEAGTTPDSIHNWLVNVWHKAEGRFSLNMSEDRHHFDLSQIGDREAIRKRSWAMAMAGSYVMVFGMDIANTSFEQLQDCRRLQDFFESTEFNRMAPHDELKSVETQYVLASPGESYIAYSSKGSKKMGLQNMEEGKYNLLWFDCVSGEKEQMNEVKVSTGEQIWKKPAGFGNEVVLYIIHADKNFRTVSKSNQTNNSKSENKETHKSQNIVPIAPDKSVSTKRNTSVDIQLSFQDPDGGPGPYTTVVLTPPAHGKLTGMGNDQTYTPQKDFQGQDQFTWKVNDGETNSKIATVRIEVME